MTSGRRRLRVLGRNLLAAVPTVLAIVILNFFLLYFTYTELSSVTRNIEEMGFNVPPLLKSFLGRAKQRVEDEVEKIGPTEEEKKDE